MYNSELVVDLVIEQCRKEKRQKQLNDLTLISKRCQKKCKTISDQIYDQETTTCDRNIDFAVLYADVDFVERSIKCRTKSVTIGQLVTALENIENLLFNEIRGLIKIHNSSESGIDLNNIVKKENTKDDCSLRFSGDTNFEVPRKYCGLNSLQIRSMFHNDQDISSEDEIICTIQADNQLYSSRYKSYSLHLNPRGNLSINLCKIVIQELANSTNGIVSINDKSGSLFRINSNNFKRWLIKNWDTYGNHHHLQHLIQDILRDEDWPKDDPLEQWSYLLWHNEYTYSHNKYPDKVIASAYLFLYKKYTNDTFQPEKWTSLETYAYCYVCHDIVDFLYDNQCNNKRAINQNVNQHIHRLQ